MWLFIGESIIDLNKIRSFVVTKASDTIILKIVYGIEDHDSFIVSTSLSTNEVLRIILDGIENNQKVIVIG
jgi:hypothetical protein